MNKFIYITSSLCILSSLACGGDKGLDAALELMPDVSSNYSTIVLTSYEDSLSTAGVLDASIQSLVSNPSQASLDDARNAWYDSREPYLQTEVYRFYEGPIDNETDGPEGLLNAWPMDESHVDYVDGNETSGIVNDTSITIDAATLESKNEEGGEENVATGYHAIEFLLWGQDFSDSGPGDRPYTDFVTGDDGTALNQDRRGQYLQVASSMLNGHLTDLIAEWNSNEGNYRSEFEGAEAEEQLRRILTGMIVLSGFETGGERLQTALDSGDQEDEHSCFSDNTHRDMVQDVQGVQNVYLGTYGSVSGLGLYDVVATVDGDLADQLADEIQASLDAANAIQPPFDQEIADTNTEGRERVQALITALRTQESTMEDVFRMFELSVPVVE